MLFVVAIVLYVLISRFAGAAGSGVRWKAPLLALGWLLVARLSDVVVGRFAEFGLLAVGAASVASLCLMLWLLWLALGRWCGLANDAARKVTLAFGAFVVSISVIAILYQALAT